MYGAFVLFIAFPVISLPLIYFFVIVKGIGMKGIWFGMSFGALFEMVVYLILFTIVFDWEEICRDVHEMLVN